MNFFNTLLSLLPGGSQAWLGGNWIYIMITLLVMAEGPVTILFAAGLSTSRYLDWEIVFLCAVVGNTIADVLWYHLGYFGRLDRAERLLRIFRVKKDTLAKLAHAVHKHAVKLIFLGKMANGIIVPILIATGLARFPFKKWFPTIFLTNIIVSAVYVFMGYHLTSNLFRFREDFRYVTLFITLLLLVGVWFYVKRVITGHTLATEMKDEEN